MSLPPCDWESHSHLTPAGGWAPIPALGPQRCSGQGPWGPTDLALSTGFVATCRVLICRTGTAVVCTDSAPDLAGRRPQGLTRINTCNSCSSARGGHWRCHTVTLSLTRKWRHLELSALHQMPLPVWQTQRWAAWGCLPGGASALGQRLRWAACWWGAASPGALAVLGRPHPASRQGQGSAPHPWLRLCDPELHNASPPARSRFRSLPGTGVDPE